MTAPEYEVYLVRISRPHIVFRLDWIWEYAGWKPLTIFAKISILDAWQSSEYASDCINQMTYFRYHNKLRTAWKVSEFFWYVFSRIRTEYGEILRTQCTFTFPAMDNSRAILYDPMVNQKLHSHNTFFDWKRWLKKRYYGNEDLDLVILHIFFFSIILILQDINHRQKSSNKKK